MYRHITTIVAIHFIALNICSAASSYAVLGYEMDERPAADKISAFITTRIGAQTGSKVISPDDANSMLNGEIPDSNQDVNGRKYCQNAGRILDVDYVVYGKAWRSDDDICIESYMVETTSGNLVGRTLAKENPDDSVLLSKAIDSSIAELVGGRKSKISTSNKLNKYTGSNSKTSWYNSSEYPFIQFIKDHVEVGLRFSHFGLFEDTERHYNEDGVFIGGFLGSIATLEPQQDYVPTIYANIILKDWFVLQFGYERFEVDTITYWDGHSDGTFKYNGPSLIAQFRYNNDSDFTPYLGAGLAMLNADFDMINWWHHGFGNPEPEAAYESWIESGAPEWPNGGYQRNLKVSEDSMFKPIVQGGCYWSITDNISLDMDLRYISLDTELDFTLSRYGNVFQDAGTTDFPMDVWIFDIGVLFNF